MNPGTKETGTATPVLPIRQTTRGTMGHTTRGTMGHTELRHSKTTHYRRKGQPTRYTATQPFARGLPLTRDDPVTIIPACLAGPAA